MPHADGAAAQRRIQEGHGLAVGAEEKRLIHRARRRLPPVEGRHPAAFPIKEEKKPAAADAGRLRLDQREHRLHRDGGIHRRAPLL